MTRLFGIFMVAGMFLVSAHAQAASPKERTKALIDAFKAVKPPPEEGKLSKADRDYNKKAFGRLDGFFDYETLTSEPIQRHKKKFSAEQLKSFKSTFRALIRLVSYPSAGVFLSGSENDIGSPKKTKGRVVVPMHVYVPEDDMEMTVDFEWARQGGNWRLVDVAFDGASLLKDYENQFGRIINKDGVDGLLKKLKQRHERELENEVVSG